MKKILIILGILFVLVTAGVFGYLMFFKTPQSAPVVVNEDEQTVDEMSEMDGDNNDTQQSAQETTTPQQSVESGSINIPEAERFTELSTTRVAGATFLSTSTIRYMQAGSGTIYDIDLTTGEEKVRVNGDEENVRHTQFNNNGTRFITEISNSESIRFLVGRIALAADRTVNLQGTLLPEDTTDARFIGSNSTVVYARSTPSGGEIYRLDPASGSSSFVTDLPYSDIRIVGETGIDTYYTHPAPSAELYGAVYRIDNGSIQYVAKGGNGLTAAVYNGGVVTTQTGENGYESVSTMTGETSTTFQPIKTTSCASIPTKDQYLICGTPVGGWPQSIAYPDDWYKGAYRFTDVIARIDTANGFAITLANPEEETGMSFDIETIVPSTYISNQYLIINKNDGRLWLFRNI